MSATDSSFGRGGFAVLVATVLATTSLFAGEFDVVGVVSLRGAIVESRPTWLAGGFGRLSEGGNGTRALGRGQVHLGFDWTPSETWRVHAHGVVQGEPESYGGRRAGLAEAFVQFRPELTPSTAIRVRAGMFFPPTSLENTDPLWQSPYAISLSLLNTWIGEEVRQLKLVLVDLPGSPRLLGTWDRASAQA